MSLFLYICYSCFELAIFDDLRSNLQLSDSAVKSDFFSNSKLTLKMQNNNIVDLVNADQQEGNQLNAVEEVKRLNEVGWEADINSRGALEMLVIQTLSEQDQISLQEHQQAIKDIREERDQARAQLHQLSDLRVAHALLAQEKKSVSEHMAKLNQSLDNHFEKI